MTVSMAKASPPHSIAKETMRWVIGFMGLLIQRLLMRCFQVYCFKIRKANKLMPYNPVFSGDFWGFPVRSGKKNNDWIKEILKSDNSSLLIMRTTKDRFSNIQLTLDWRTINFSISRHVGQSLGQTRLREIWSLDLDTSTSPSAGILLSIHVSPVVIMGKSVQDFVNLYGCDSRFEKNIE